MKTFVVVNPSAAGGATMRRWPDVCERLEKAIGKFDYEFTNAEGVATLLSNDAVKKGYEKIISVGGDGTLHEVVQGLFDESGLINSEIIIGMLPFGSGADFAKALKISNTIDEAIEVLSGEDTKKIDLGRVDFKDHRGEKGRRYLINMADVGLGGVVVDKVNSSSKILGGFATYLISSLISFFSYEPKRVKIKADEKEFEQIVTTVLVNNGAYCGSGMHIAPEAEIDDGYFDVVIIEEISKRNLISFLPKLYSGKLLSQPGVKHLKAKKISVESDEDILINLDGEQPGTTPVTFEILPSILNFII